MSIFKNEDEYVNKDIKRMCEWVPEKTPIFVFGSNLAGRHGKGAALHALKYHGAVYGQGIGRQGRSYAIPTKDANLKTLNLSHIAMHVQTFIEHATFNPNDTFELTPIGCGLAGYRFEDIAPFFEDAPPNVNLPNEFKRILENE